MSNHPMVIAVPGSRGFHHLNLSQRVFSQNKPGNAHGEDDSEKGSGKHIISYSSVRRTVS